MKITCSDRLVPGNDEEEKLVETITTAINGGIVRETLPNNGTPFSSQESLDKFNKYAKTPLFSKILSLK